MTGTDRSLEHLGQFRHADTHAALDAVRIHVHDRWQEQHVAAGRFEARRIRIGCARIAREVLIRTELGRVDEDAGDDDIGVRARLCDQRMMARVQIAHRRHQADAPLAAEQIADQGVQCRAAAKDLHDQ